MGIHKNNIHWRLYIIIYRNWRDKKISCETESQIKQNYKYKFGINLEIYNNHYTSPIIFSNFKPIYDKVFTSDKYFCDNNNYIGSIKLLDFDNFELHLLTFHRKRRFYMFRGLDFSIRN